MEPISSRLPEDLLQDIARSSYADMLNDDERNRAYDQAIRICVSTLVQTHRYNPTGEKFFKCCDIGTGSGLLSMMIVRAFKEIKYEHFSVTAFESFKPMAACAQRVISQAGMLDYITVIPSSSDSLDENPMFDLLVAELLDTELIGEGCLVTYKHAVDFLCSPTCLFVPYKARIYIEPIASTVLFNRHAIGKIDIPLREDNRVHIKVPQEVASCCGLAAIDDMQVSALREGIDFHRVSESKIAFQIIFNDRASLIETDIVELNFPINRKVTQPIVVAMWWDIVMYDSERVNSKLAETFSINLEELSCAPTWARSEELQRRDKKIRDIYKRDVWREHWIQGIYYFSNVVKTRSLVGLTTGESLYICAHRDLYSLWFELDKFAISENNLPESCYCGVHRALSRSQVAFLNNRTEMRKLFEALIAKYRTTSTVYNGHISFRSRPLGPTITSYEAPKWKIDFIKATSLIDPCFTDENPWEKVVEQQLSCLNSGPVQSFVIKFAQVYFENLNRIRAKVDNCEGFNLEPMNRMVGESSRVIDKAIESHHLWEYESKRLSEDTIVLSSTILSYQRDEVISGEYKQSYSLPIKNCLFEYKKGWALVFWAEFKLRDTDEVISTGPVESEAEDDTKIVWNRYYKQLVYFLHDHELSQEESSKKEIPINITMNGAFLNVTFPAE